MRWRAGIEWKLASRADPETIEIVPYGQSVWPVRQSSNEYRMARRVLMAEVSGMRVRGRPR